MIKYKLAFESSIREVVNSSNLWVLHDEELANRTFTCPCCDIPAVVLDHHPGERSAYFHYEEPHAKNCAIFLDLYTEPLAKLFSK